MFQWAEIVALWLVFPRDVSQRDGFARYTHDIQPHGHRLGRETKKTGRGKPRASPCDQVREVFISYNRAFGINAGTAEGREQIVVTFQGRDGAKSLQLVTLGPNVEWINPLFKLTTGTIDGNLASFVIVRLPSTTASPTENPKYAKKKKKKQ